MFLNHKARLYLKHLLNECKFLAPIRTHLNNLFIKCLSLILLCLVINSNILSSKFLLIFMKILIMITIVINCCKLNYFGNNTTIFHGIFRCAILQKVCSAYLREAKPKDIYIICYMSELTYFRILRHEKQFVLVLFYHFKEWFRKEIYRERNLIFHTLLELFLNN